jgi:hypothetical protein
VEQRFSGPTGRTKRDALLSLRCLVLSSVLLGVLLRHVSSHHAATDRSDDGVVSRVMPGDPAYDRAFEAAGGVCRSYCCQCKRHSRQGNFRWAIFHSKVL